MVVWYDPRNEFVPFVDSLPAKSDLKNGISTVSVGGIDVSLAQFKSSYFELKAAVEPLLADDLPGQVLLYLSGVSIDTKGLILMRWKRVAIALNGN